MDICKLKWTRLQNEIFRLFCIKAGQTLNLRAVAKELGVTPTAVSKAIAELEKEAIVNIKKSETMNLLSIELQRDNPKVIQLKRIENIKLLYESGLSDFLYNEFPGSTIIIFGSYSRGEDMCTERQETNSDIDIAIIGRKEKHISLAPYAKILQREIHLNFYETWQKVHKDLKNNILNGVVLSGVIEL